MAFSAICLLGIGYVALAQGGGYNQNAHFALVRALAEGTPKIDKTRFEVGDTGDIAIYQGHVYSNKVPGLAFVALPPYLVLKALGYAKTGGTGPAGPSGPKPGGDMTGQLWFLNVWAVVLPALVLLALLWKIADELEPGFGAAAAVTLGLATLMFPFSTMFFAHALSAALSFASFVLLWYERDRAARLSRVVAAGALAGFAITTELPCAIVAAVLGLYALIGSGPVLRGLAYGSGAILGLLPLLLFNAWAFGSPTHSAIQSSITYGYAGPSFIGWPSLHGATEILFGSVGSLRLTPVLSLGAVGGLLLYRRGERREALLIGAIVLAFLVFNSGIDGPFGGHSSPGSRYMIPTLPFVALPLALAYRRFPLTTAALAVVSAAEMVAVTITTPLLAGWDLAWFHRLFHWEVGRTSLDMIGAPESLGYGLFFSVVVLAAVLAVRASATPDLSPRDALTGVAVVTAWVLIERRSLALLDSDDLGNGNGAYLMLLVAAGATLFVVTVPSMLTTGRWRRLAEQTRRVHDLWASRRGNA